VSVRMYHRPPAPSRCCPECSRRKYVFPWRKKVPAEAEQPAVVETKYRSRTCGHACGDLVTAKEAG